MTDEKFKELINLYLDKEISEEELNLLKKEIGENPERERSFLESRRLHEAMCLALNPEHSRSRSRSGRSRSHSGSRRSSSRRSRSRSRSGASTKVARADELASASNVVPFPRWLLLPGMAACLLVGFVLLQPVFRDTVDPAAQPELVGVDARDLVVEDSLASLEKSDFRRFALAQEQREAKPHASLVSQMRLMGLRPELTPKDKQLQEVNLAANYKPKQEVNQVELFERIQGTKEMPEVEFFRVEESEPHESLIWTKEFDSSLTTF